MKNPIVSVYCFHVVDLSITAAFGPVIKMELEAIIGGFKCLHWLLKHKIVHPLTFNIDFMQGSLETL